jgi:predicted HAD superfamily Cof-like phosphohydrolase
MKNKVKEFMTIGRQLINESPSLTKYNDYTLRYNLMKEENKEYLQACHDHDKIEILDALVDQMYVLLGTIHQHGMSNIFEEAFNRVHENNMSKFPNGQILRDAEGKILKPEGFKPVDLSDLV